MGSDDFVYICQHYQVARIMTRQQLIDQIKKKRSFLCVGLDTDLKKIPECLKDSDDPIFEFNRRIIDATAPYTVSYKPNVAFYESLGSFGFLALQKTISYIKEQYPHMFVIADAKRGDIGNTSDMYARTFFDLFKADAVTVAPYMGVDSVTPFLQYSDKWVILLALTSNSGSQDFQHLPVGSDGRRLFEQVLETSKAWGDEETIMYVAGATQATLFKDIRAIVPNSFLLVPGVGAQGGSLEEVCEYGMTSDCGLLVNASRSIIYADDTEHFAEKAAEQAKLLQIEMEKALLERGILD